MKILSCLPALAIIAILFTSCSSDAENNNSVSTDISGTWDATALQINEANATTDEEFARDILDFLTAKDCYVLSFTFNEDLSVIAENSVNYVEINVNPGGTGLDIPCPAEKDTEVSTYTFDGEVLTIIDPNDTEVAVGASLSGNTLLLNAADLDIPNFNSGGTLVFTRR